MNQIQRYITGFIFSLVLTLSAYMLVVNQIFNNKFLIVLILVCAVLQFVVQVTFFLHLGKDYTLRWNMAMFVSTLMLILIVLVGSMWIMGHLNYNHRTPAQINDYIQQQENIFR